MTPWKLLGAAMVATPFVLIFAAVSIRFGFQQTAFMFAIALALTWMIVAGVKMLSQP